MLSELRDVEVIAWDEVGPETVKTDIVHRPYQVSTANELVRLRHLGERLVITHLDMIAYRNPDYFRGFPEWQLYQKVTRDALGLADAVVFLSHHAAADVEFGGSDAPWPGARGRCRDRQPPLQHAMGAATAAGRGFARRWRLPPLPGGRLRSQEQALRPPGAGRVADAARMVGQTGDGRPAGAVWVSSRAEAEFLLRHPSVAQAVVRLAAVTEGEKRWLFQRAAGVCYPTVYEGFGLVPFEAVGGRRTLFLRPAVCSWPRSSPPPRPPFSPGRRGHGRSGDRGARDPNGPRTSWARSGRPASGSAGTDVASSCCGLPGDGGRSAADPGDP